MKATKLYQSLVAAIVIFALGAPAIASADDKSDLRGVSTKVSYEDLNVEKLAGAKVLYQRLQLASKQVCDMRSTKQERSAQRTSEAKQCYRIALTTAVEEINNELLTQIHYQ